MQDPTTTEIYQACLKLFLEYGGRHISRIERELRARGHEFHRRTLYNRGTTLGWIDRYNWRALVKGERIKAEGENEDPCKSPRVSKGGIRRPVTSDECQVTSEAPGNAGALACMSDSENNRTVPPAQPEETSRQAAKSQSGEEQNHESQISNNISENRNPGPDASQTWNLEPGISRTTANGQQPPANPRPPLPPFPEWLREVSPNMKWNWRQHRIICSQLERFTRGEINRLMIFIPPRHGKSELVTVRYTSWRIKREPETNVIVAGYGQRLADRFSRKIRNVLSDAAEKGERLKDKGEGQNQLGHPSGRHNSDQFNGQNLEPGTWNPAAACQPPTANSSPPTAYRPTHPSCPCCSPRHSRRINTVSEWETHAGGGLRAVGVGGAVTGFGANLIIIDDPVKNRAQAESKTYRDRTWDWYNDDIRTRLEPGGGIILIQTRWHHDDLAGRLLREMDAGGEQWEVIRLAALKEKDEGGRMKDEASACESPRSCESPRVSKGGIGTQTEEISRKDAKSQSGPGNAGALACMSDSENDRTAPPAQPEETSRQDAKTQSGPGNAGALACMSDSENDRTAPPAQPEETSRQDAKTQSSEVEAAACHRSTANCHPFSDDRAPGEPLCPERFDVEAFEKLRRQLGTYAFSALYQQSPTPADGGIFKRHWFSRFVTAPPPGLTWVRGYDLAVSTGTSADHTASFLCAFDDNGVLYIDGGFRARIEYPDQRRYILERLEAEPDVLHGVETALHGMAFIQDIRTDPRALGRQLKGVKVGTDKVTRALTWSPLAEDGKVVLVRGAWNEELIEEASSFPAGRHDDQVDAISLAVQLLAELKSAKPVIRHTAAGF